MNQKKYHSFGKVEHLHGVPRKYYRKDIDGTEFVDFGHIDEIGGKEILDHANNFGVVRTVE